MSVSFDCHFLGALFFPLLLHIADSSRALDSLLLQRQMMRSGWCFSLTAPWSWKKADVVYWVKLSMKYFVILPTIVYTKQLVQQLSFFLLLGWRANEAENRNEKVWISIFISFRPFSRKQLKAERQASEKGFDRLEFQTSTMMSDN